jgi:hypothetical protein
MSFARKGMTTIGQRFATRAPTTVNIAKLSPPAVAGLHSMRAFSEAPAFSQWIQKARAMGADMVLLPTHRKLPEDVLTDELFSRGFTPLPDKQELDALLSEELEARGWYGELANDDHLREDALGEEVFARGL